jgi:hypothetical protein
LSLPPLVEAKAKLRAELLERRAGVTESEGALAAATVADQLSRRFLLPEAGLV